MNIENDFLTDFDLFGKLPELYYKGKSKKSSILGIVLTVIYIVLYIAFLILSQLENKGIHIQHLKKHYLIYYLYYLYYLHYLYYY